MSSSKRVAKIWIGTKSTNRSEFTTRRMFARSAELSLFTGAETVFVSGGRCFRVAVAATLQPTRLLHALACRRPSTPGT